MTTSRLAVLVLLGFHACCAAPASDTDDVGWDFTQLLKKPQPDGRIVGGAPAPIQSFPYQLSLRFNGRHICGASIISDYYAITAAHCIDRPVEVERLSLRSGTAWLYSGGSVHRVLNVTVNPQYDAFAQDFDLAIIKVEQPFKTNARSAAIALPVSGVEPPVGTPAIVTGWGVTREGLLGPSMNLLYVSVPVVSSEECARNYVGYGTITPRMLCAGYQEGQRDACQGDSGGPLVADNVLVGVVSWGAGCARPGLPGVYTHLGEPSLRAWITHVTDGIL